MREFRTSGSVGGRRGDPSVYPTTNLLFDPTSGDEVVAVTAIERVAGETRGFYATNNLVDLEAVSDSSLFINSESVVNGEDRGLSATFKAQLTADLTSPDTFDSDIDNDGTNDFRSIDVAAKGRATSADPCTNLGVLP